MRFVPEVGSLQTSSAFAEPCSALYYALSHFVNVPREVARLALRCAASRDKMRTCVFALCCHHLCRYDTFFSDRDMLDECGFGAGDFAFACRLTTRYRVAVTRSTTAAARTAALASALAKACKRMLNELRAAELRRRGWDDVRLALYVDESVSPENCVLIARR